MSKAEFEKKDSPKPDSVKLEPWASFSWEAYNTILDEYYHSKLFTAKLTQNPGRGGINLK
jgi:hypothetical protein